MQIYSAGDGAVAGAADDGAGRRRHGQRGRGGGGSLQRAGRAIVVGSRSYGKGTVQAVEPLTRGGALKLTVAVFRAAGGERVNHRGVLPDVVAVNRPATRVDQVLRAALRVLASR